MDTWETIKEKSLKWRFEKTLHSIGWKTNILCYITSKSYPSGESEVEIKSQFKKIFKEVKKGCLQKHPTVNLCNVN